MVTPSGTLFHMSHTSTHSHAISPPPSPSSPPSAIPRFLTTHTSLANFFQKKKDRRCHPRISVTEVQNKHVC
ncbi:hypothetical protein COCC4DRAFT_30535 [Bipolaris maydis ATCC 48331]|uniref:Uncharacterized protein n=2 Tax=Cochliobolus heterostrophus TaxID=5016 RepID=M2UCE6_COCH5|nr:uncharacterized protein COCC4DRAFT_30535 [Bipolaris maydis ATCC 48331]EMD91341.1 hypothetical protein COCHEDRAFT_1021403 [Bipolaris maydis C5]ENI08902.1 hypothetical protein COCC4DRAFT_30535 [Bipolaris maydis ATCC 48331]